MTKSKSFLDHILSIVPTHNSHKNKLKGCSNIKIKTTCDTSNNNNNNNSLNKNEKLEQVKIECIINIFY